MIASNINPIQNLRTLADWCERHNLTRDEIVCLDSGWSIGAHLHIHALARLWPGRVFETTRGSTDDGPRQIYFDEDGVRVSCVVEHSERVRFAAILSGYPEVAEQNAEAVA